MMISDYFLGAAIVLMGTGVVFTTAASVILTYRAFRASPALGLICALLPLATFAYVIRHWHEAKGVFLTQVFGVVCAGAGAFLLLADPGLRTIMKGQIDPSLLPALSEFPTLSEANTGAAKLLPSPHPHKTPTREQRLQHTKALYLRLQSWHDELVKKQPAANADAAQAEAFRKEYASYQSLLAEYKAAAGEFRSPRPSPSPGGK